MTRTGPMGGAKCHPIPALVSLGEELALVSLGEGLVAFSVVTIIIIFFFFGFFFLKKRH